MYMYRSAMMITRGTPIVYTYIQIRTGRCHYSSKNDRPSRCSALPQAKLLLKCSAALSGVPLRLRTSQSCPIDTSSFRIHTAPRHRHHSSLRPGHLTRFPMPHMYTRRSPLTINCPGKYIVPFHTSNITSHPRQNHNSQNALSCPIPRRNVHSLNSRPRHRTSHNPHRPPHKIRARLPLRHPQRRRFWQRRRRSQHPSTRLYRQLASPHPHQNSLVPRSSDTNTRLWQRRQALTSP